MGSSSSDSPSLSQRGGTDRLRPPESVRYLSLLCSALRRLWRLALVGIRPVAFWVAVMLPLVYLPPLYGFGTGWYMPLLVELILLHVLSIFLGHGHTPFWSS
ncbi:MAG: hypothetical protein ABEH86_03375 [Haloarcula sp.]